jgi:methyl-accepting chemotaxis protein
MIAAIDSDVRSTVTNVDVVGKAVHLGGQLTASAAGVSQISQHAQELLIGISAMARQTQGQSATGEQLSVAVQGVSRLSDQNDRAIKVLFHQSTVLRRQADELGKQLTQFAG